jgi:large subunit ribosomal protein L35Ae
MKGIIVQFRRGRKTVHERHFLLDLGFKDREEAKKSAGKEVEWKSSAGKVIKGKISDAHGNNGMVRAIFERGLPGQAITDSVEVLDSGDSDKKDESKEGEYRSERKKEEGNVKEKKAEEKVEKVQKEEKSNVEEKKAGDEVTDVKKEENSSEEEENP